MSRTKAGEAMKDFSRGVSFYTFGVLEVGFPEDDICCHWCPLLGIEARLERPYCKKTGEILVNTKFGVGTNCPVRFFGAGSEEKEESDKNDISWSVTGEFPF